MDERALPAPAAAPLSNGSCSADEPRRSAPVAKSGADVRPGAAAAPAAEVDAARVREAPSPEKCCRFQASTLVWSPDGEVGKAAARRLLAHELELNRVPMGPPTETHACPDRVA